MLNPATDTGYRVMAYLNVLERNMSYFIFCQYMV